MKKPSKPQGIANYLMQEIYTDQDSFDRDEVRAMIIIGIGMFIGNNGLGAVGKTLDKRKKAL